MVPAMAKDAQALARIREGDEYLTQRKRDLLPASRFHFAIVSRRRCQSVANYAPLFALHGIVPTWYVPVECEERCLGGYCS